MSDELNAEEARKFIEKNISSIHKDLVLEALNADDVSRTEEIGLTLAGERKAVGFAVPTGGPETKGRIWPKIVAEVYEYFCTNSKAYDRERKQGFSLFENAVTVVVTSLAATLSLGTGIITGLVTVAILTVLKMGRNAWCKATAEELGVA